MKHSTLIHSDSNFNFFSVANLIMTNLQANLNNDNHNKQAYTLQYVTIKPLKITTKIKGPSKLKLT